MGVMASVLFIMEGSVDAMQSAWAGPPGGLVRALCFDPKTQLRLRNGSLREIQNIKLCILRTKKNSISITEIIKLLGLKIQLYLVNTKMQKDH